MNARALKIGVASQNARRCLIVSLTVLLLLNLCSNTATAQGALTDGSTYTGTITFAGDSDTWTFTATNGDSVVLRAGTLMSTNNFGPWLRVYGPDGTLLGSYDPGLPAVSEVTLQATNSGTFTVLVADGSFFNGNYAGTGTYELSYDKTPGALVVSPGQQGGPLTNGTLNTGTITVGDIQAWTFTATNGDSVVLRAGTLLGTNNFGPWLRVYGPDGTLLGSYDPGSPTVSEVTLRATNSGVFTVLVADGSYYNDNYGGTGTYQLSYDKTPGALVVSPGEEGGPLTNGTVNTGTITVGDIQAWTFTATNGDSVVLRAGTLMSSNNFGPWLRVYGPDGTLLGSYDPGSPTVSEVTLRATNSGVFTVLVADGSYYNDNYGGTGTYQLSYDKTPGALVVSPGEQGGPLTNGTLNAGTITVGDIQAWTFTATNGDSVVLRAGRLSGSYFGPLLRVYGPDGTLLGSYDPGSPAVSEVTLRATNSGTFTVLVADGSYYNGDDGDAGTYQLSYVKAPGALVVSPGEEGGPLTNGTVNTGTITVGDIQAWTFTATNGDSVVLRAGGLSGSYFGPLLRVYGPDGTLLGSYDPGSPPVSEVTLRATNSGTFTVLVADGSYYNGDDGDAGTYQLSYVKAPGTLVISPGEQGGPLTNGTLNAGTITVGDLQAWTFTAQAGQALVVRAGRVSGNLGPWVRLYGPDGVQVGGNAGGSTVNEVTVQATESGTFTVVFGDYSSSLGGSGDYQLTLAKTGSPIVVSPGDEGGPMTNGVMHTGTISVGDLDVWSFMAQAGQALVVRAGRVSGNLGPWVRLYGPDGVQVGGNAGGSTVNEVTVQATESGTFTVVFGDYSSSLGGSGDYRLTLAKTGSPVEVSPGDEGGPMNGIDVYDGTIDIGDLDVWSFNAFTSNTISINVTELVSGSPLVPWVRLYGRDGTLLKSVSGAATAGFVMSAPATGSYLVVVGDGSSSLGDSGTYAMTVNGLSDAWRVGIPSISGANFHFNEVGGTPNATFVLLTTTNLTIPANLWTPVLTNQFDQFGVFSYTNTYNPVQRQQFYRFSMP